MASRENEASAEIATWTCTSATTAAQTTPLAWQLHPPRLPVNLYSTADLPTQGRALGLVGLNQSPHLLQPLHRGTPYRTARMASRQLDRLLSNVLRCPVEAVGTAAVDSAGKLDQSNLETCFFFSACTYIIISQEQERRREVCKTPEHAFWFKRAWLSSAFWSRRRSSRDSHAYLSSPRERTLT